MNHDEITTKDVLEHELEEWRYLNGNISAMENGYMQGISLMLAVVTGILAIIFAAGAEGAVRFVFFLIPPVLTVILAFIGYQFRVTAILRGHLAHLEQSMNKKLKQDVHLWNSALVEMFMAKNNEINTFIMGPSLFAVGIVIVVSVYFTYGVCCDIDCYGMAIFAVYWLLEAALAAVILVSFLRNETIRRTTERCREEYVGEYKAFLETQKGTVYGKK